MAAKALVTIAGIALPTPATYIGGTYDIVDATRNVQGITIGSIVREDVGKVEMTWRFLTPAQWSTILKLFNSVYGGSFYNSVEFYNQVTATWVTRTMYVGDRTTGGALQCDPVTGAPTFWIEPALNLIEV